MCGFIASFGVDVNQNDFKNALKHLSRRGPDSEGIWVENKVFLGSRRLAIFDLNNRSDQPMHSSCSRYIIIFNGSIYNYKVLRKYLIDNNIRLKTHSDTEVILELFALEGPKMLSKLEGMFAFVIWDCKEKKAFAARDPFGIKPMYIGTNLDGIILSSQVKALLSTKLINNDKDINSQFSFWNLGYVMEPRTWFKNIKALKSGYYIYIKDGKIISEIQWYDLNKNWIIADSKEKKITKREFSKIIKDSIIASVKKHLIADVPIGIFLSSGIDSTIIASIASSNSNKKITAITVSFESFDGSEYDETIKAKKIAQKFGMEHHVFRVTQKDFQNDLPDILEAMDQPSIDGVNVWYASKAAAKLKLKVVFSGVGGDELFFGYNHFNTIPIVFNLFKYLKKIPTLIFFIKIFLKLISNLKKDKRWRTISKFSNSIFNLWLLKRTILTPIDIIDNKILSNKIDTEFFYHNNFDTLTLSKIKNHKIQLAKIESTFYMRNQLLRDSDWASMYHGVELRTPLVDTTLLENLTNVMSSYSLYKDKQPLKSAFKTILPKDIDYKKKIGFQTPTKDWIKNYIKDETQISNNDWFNYMKVVFNLFNKI
jgi:asparagine synthase (glutamine-hydrolysing)